MGVAAAQLKVVSGFLGDTLVGGKTKGNFCPAEIPDGRSTELATPFVDRPSGISAGQKFPFVFPPTNVSPKNPDTTFNWAGATPIGGSDYYYYKNKMPYVQEWELSFQRQLGTATVLSV